MNVDIDEISSAVSRLPDNEKLAFRMVYVEGYSKKETAICSAVTMAKLSKTLERAKCLLREDLS